MHAAALAAVGQQGESAAVVAQTIAALPGIAIETMANAPGFGTAERRRMIETMRLAGFPACAGPEVLRAAMAVPTRLPECAATAGRASADP